VLGRKVADLDSCIARLVTVRDRLNEELHHELHHKGPA